MTLLDKFQEYDFAMFKKGLVSGRLNPIRIGKIILLINAVNLLFIYLGEEAAKYNINNSFYTSWLPLFNIEWYSLIFLAAVSLPFLSKKCCLKFQKSEILLLMLTFINMTFDVTSASLIIWKADFSHLPFKTVFFLYIVSSVLIFFLTLLVSSKFSIKNTKG